MKLPWWIVRNWAFIRQLGFIKWIYRYSLWHFSKEILKKDMHIKLPSGITMKLPKQSGVGAEIFLTNCNVDWGSESLLLKFFDKNKDFIDVGANIGYYSLLASPLVRNVYAFEPNPNNLPTLEENAKKTTNIFIITEAVYVEKTVMRFELGDDSATSHLLTSDENSEKSIEVSAISLDSFLDENPQLNVGSIKIDVEGFDMDVLIGALRVITLHQPIILTEFNQGIGVRNNSEELYEFVNKIGYIIFGFIADKQTPNNRKFNLIKLEDLESCCFKMLFLVPDHFKNNFREFLAG